MSKREQIIEVSESLKRDNKPRKIVELSKFYNPHTHKHELIKETLEALAKKRVREKQLRYSHQIGTNKYDYPMETLPNVLTVVKIIKILKDMDDRLTLLEESVASLGERLAGLMEKILIRVGKNESKLEDLEFRTMSYEASQ